MPGSAVHFLPSWAVGALWVCVSLASLSLSLAVVYYNVLFVVVELACVLLLRQARHALRWLSLPLPSRWSHKRAVWRQREAMYTSCTYEAWLASARALDDLEGGTAWRGERYSEEYDVQLILDSTRRLRDARVGRDVHNLMLALRSVVHRGYGGIARPSLYEQAFTGTKAVLEAFITEVCASVDAVAGAGELLPAAVRVAFIDALRIQLGRTALALSGGGALALAHAGCVRTLLCAGLLPRVISGTSGGAMIAGMMAVHSDAELLASILVPRIVSARGPENTFFGPPWAQLHSFLTTGRLVDTERFSAVLRAYIGEDTFLSAFDRTGRIVNVSVVARAGPHAAYNLQLNYLTAPSVLIWSAVAASCALPGLMRPVTMLAKEARGGVVPYHTPGLMTVDGSMAVDVPRTDLALLFHVDTLLVSQANPHVVPFLTLAKESLSAPRARATLDGNFLSRTLRAASLWLLLDIRHRVHLLVGLRLLPKWFGEDSGPLFAQSYTGDVTFIPYQRPFEAWRALAQPSEADMAALILAGQRATWPHLAHVRTLLAVEKKLSLCSRRLGGGGGHPSSGTLRGLSAPPAHDGAGLGAVRPPSARPGNGGRERVVAPAHPPTTSGPPAPLVRVLSYASVHPWLQDEEGEGDGEGGVRTELQLLRDAGAFPAHQADGGGGGGGGSKTVASLFTSSLTPPTAVLPGRRRCPLARGAPSPPAAAPDTALLTPESGSSGRASAASVGGGEGGGSGTWLPLQDYEEEGEEEEEEGAGGAFFESGRVTPSLGLPLHSVGSISSVLCALGRGRGRVGGGGTALPSSRRPPPRDCARLGIHSPVEQSRAEARSGPAPGMVDLAQAAAEETELHHPLGPVHAYSDDASGVEGGRPASLDDATAGELADTAHPRVSGQLADVVEADLSGLGGGELLSTPWGTALHGADGSGKAGQGDA